MSFLEGFVLRIVRGCGSTKQRRRSGRGSVRILAHPSLAHRLSLQWNVLKDRMRQTGGWRWDTWLNSDLRQRSSPSQKEAGIGG